MNAEALIDDVKRRLVALADDPPFRFKRTSRTAAQGYVNRMTHFEGCSETEIAGVEANLGVRFTTVFRAYLRQMGKSRGHLFRGSDVAQPSRFEEFRRFGQDLMRETRQSLVLPNDAVVFLIHQGYQFAFIQPHGGFDCPVAYYTETDEAPEQVADSFAEFVNAAVTLMEENHRRSHEMGGHYVTVDENGGTRLEFPALARGERATDEPFKLGD